MRGIARRRWATAGMWVAGIVGAVAVVMLLWSSGGPTVYATPEETSTAEALLSATPTATATHTPVPTPNEDCDLSVTKSDSPDPVSEGGEITYTITVDNNGDGNGYCTDLTVTDTIPDDTDCVDATVDSSSDVDFDEDDINGCDSSGDVTWETTENLYTGDQAVVTMVVELTSGATDGDRIDNEVCVTSSDDEVGDCDTERTTVTEATATPTPGPTATLAPIPTTAYVPPPVAPAPTAAIAPLIVPSTGSGTGSGGFGGLALALGLAGGALVLLSGGGLWLRRRS